MVALSASVAVLAGRRGLCRPGGRVDGLFRVQGIDQTDGSSALDADWQKYKASR